MIRTQSVEDFDGFSRFGAVKELALVGPDKPVGGFPLDQVLELGWSYELINAMAQAGGNQLLVLDQHESNLPGGGVYVYNAASLSNFAKHNNQLMQAANLPAEPEQLVRALARDHHFGPFVGHEDSDRPWQRLWFSSSGWDFQHEARLEDPRPPFAVAPHMGTRTRRLLTAAGVRLPEYKRMEIIDESDAPPREQIEHHAFAVVDSHNLEYRAFLGPAADSIDPQYVLSTARVMSRVPSEALDVMARRFRGMFDDRYLLRLANKARWDGGRAAASRSSLFTRDSCLFAVSYLTLSAYDKPLQREDGHYEVDDHHELNHAWVCLPDGRKLDPTADQNRGIWGAAIVPVDSAEQRRYLISPGGAFIVSSRFIPWSKYHPCFLKVLKLEWDKGPEVEDLQAQISSGLSAERQRTTPRSRGSKHMAHGL